MRVATRIDRDTMRQIKLRAAIDGRTIRSRVAEAFGEWLTNHPVDRRVLRTAVR